MGRKHQIRTGETIKNFKLLDHKVEKRFHYYWIKCLLCGNEKWMRYRTIMNPVVQACGCYQKSKSTRDLTGQTFGLLTVIAPTTERASNGSIIWECKCSCGNKKKASGTHLIRRGVKSCGCLGKERFVRACSPNSEGDHKWVDPRDQIGMSVNVFELLDYKYEKGYHRYLIKCSRCGNKKWMGYSTIINPETKSCGCQRGKSRKKDIIGQKFGRLIAVRPTERRHQNSVIWDCECSCGGEKQVSARDLMRGHTKSCGCLYDEKFAESSERFGVEGTNLTALTMKIPKDNTSGVKGVWWKKDSKRWQANIVFQGKNIYLGKFKDFNDATQARKEAEEKYYKPMLVKYKDRLTSEQIAKLESNE